MGAALLLPMLPGGWSSPGGALPEHTSTPRTPGASTPLAQVLPLRSGSKTASSWGGGEGGGTAGRCRIVSNLKYVQFHSTALCLPGEPCFLLIMEDLRGEGVILRNADRRAFAQDYHPNYKLALRDIVVHAVYKKCRHGQGGGAGSGSGGSNPGHNVYLVITHRDPALLAGRFPGVHAHLTSMLSLRPLDFTREWIPVTPMAHYTCSRVTTHLNGCVVLVPAGHRYCNLYVVGKTARMWLHGGNQLASTSLLEGLFFGSSIARWPPGSTGHWRQRGTTPTALLSASWQ